MNCHDGMDMEAGVQEEDMLAIGLNETWHLGADKANSEVVVL